MARYIGPTCRQCRYLNEKLMLKGERCSSIKCPLGKKSTLHKKRQFGRRQRRVSDRGLQLREKQKIRFSYGVLERQFRRFFSEAVRAPGITGDTLLALLERRLDNVVYRLGFAESRAQARQIVLHGHIMVNEHRTNIPSFLVKPGDSIKWREASKKTEYYKRLVEEIGDRTIPGWLSLDKAEMISDVSTLPGKDDIDAKFNGKAVVEYFSR